MIETRVRPRGPYSLRLSLPFGDATRTARDGVLTAAFEVDGRAEIGRAGQSPDGTIWLRAPSEGTIDQLRFTLALDDDHAPFLARYSRDPVLGETIRSLRGLRPPRVATVAHALLRAVCGQLITARRARAIERNVVTAATAAAGDSGLHLAPSAAALARFSPAELRRLGLGTRRGAALVRLCRSVELERLRSLPTATAAERIERERGLGPWSVGVVCLEGLGRTERGLVRDLGLVKLCSAMRGRWVETWETAELLEPYGEWAGLASVYMLAGARRGLIPVERELAA